MGALTLICRSWRTRLLTRGHARVSKEGTNGLSWVEKPTKDCHYGTPACPRVRPARRSRGVWPRHRAGDSDGPYDGRPAGSRLQASRSPWRSLVECFPTLQRQQLQDGSRADLMGYLRQGGGRAGPERIDVLLYTKCLSALYTV